MATDEQVVGEGEVGTVPPQLLTNVQTELEEVRTAAADGLLRPAAVVEWARRHEQSVLHGQFEWDDTKAAEAHRISQARGIIRTVVTILPQTRQSGRLYVSIPTDRIGGGGYRRTGDAVAMPAYRLQLAEEALKVVEQLPGRFSYLPELAPLWQEITAAAARHRAALNAQAAVPAA